eukprot:TRINITY_DN1417_c0_g1_i2.p1 TRINITY_DN1417_c0_g1~~TRINITY_DN1417_c0_g1_i2.p1  ORF type:complete len:422 (-),score=183.05 TRINITY_DN1417_c0_g1_i2:674-1939(-)
MSRWLKSLESGLEYLDKKTADTAGSPVKKTALPPGSDEGEYFKFLNKKGSREILDQDQDDDEAQNENRLLRDEIISLNQELTTMSNKLRTTEQDLDQVSMDMQEAQRTLYEKDKLIASMKKRELEFDTKINDKNATASNMQSKIDEVKDELRLRDQKISQLQEKLNHLTFDKNSTAEASNYEKQVFTDQISQLELQLEDSRKEMNSMKQQHLEKQVQLESNMASLQNSLANAQRSLDEKSYEITRLGQQIKETHDNEKSVRQELSDYKLRATKVLQAKEKEIRDLTENSGIKNIQVENSLISADDLTKLQTEKEALKEERDEARSKISQLENEIMENEAAIREELSQQILKFEELVEKERRKVTAFNLEISAKNQEVFTIREEIERVTRSASETTRAKDAEIARLKREVIFKLKFKLKDSS